MPTDDAPRTDDDPAVVGSGAPPPAGRRPTPPTTLQLGRHRNHRSSKHPKKALPMASELAEQSSPDSEDSPSRNKRRMSACGAPIPSFRCVAAEEEGILDKLERELRECDAEDKTRRIRRREREKIRQRRIAWRNDDRDAAKAKKVIELLSSDGEDDDGVLNFDFRGGGGNRRNEGERREGAADNPPKLAALPASEDQEGGGREPKATGADKDDDDALDDDHDTSCGEILGDSVPLQQPLLDSTNRDAEPVATNHSSTGVDPATATMLRESAATKATRPFPFEPQAQLLLWQALQEIVARSDWRTCTAKQVFADLERRFGLPLDRETRAKIRGRLVQLILQHQRLAGSPTATNTSISADTKDMRLAENQPSLPDHTRRSAGGQTKGTEGERLDDPPKLRVDEGVAKPAPKQWTDAAVAPKPEELSSDPSKGIVAAIPKRRGRNPKAPPVAPIESASATPLALPPQTKRRRSATAKDPTGAPRTKKRTCCALCRNCPCQATEESAGATTTAVTVRSLSQSDAAIEKALLRRLHKLEQAAERYDEQTDAVRRKLKKHRRDMWRKWEQRRQEAETASTSGRPTAPPSRFLPDVEEMDRHCESRTGSVRLGAAAVERAQATVFSFAPTYQPTLTQMFGSRSAEQEEDEVVQPMDRIVEETESQVFDEAEEHSSQVVDEDRNGAEDVDDKEIESEARVDLPTEALEVQRVELRSGVEATEAPSRIWCAYLDGRGPQSVWDRIFEDPTEVHDWDLRQLETLFESVQSQDASTAGPPSPVSSSMLTQRGRSLADEIVSRIASDTQKMARLESACPSWQENVRFAMHQQTAEGVKEALEGVQEAQAKLLLAKEAVLRAIHAQEDALQVFAESLTKSLTRLESSNGDHVIEECGGSSRPPALVTTDVVRCPSTPPSLEVCRRFQGNNSILRTLSASCRSQSTLAGSPSCLSFRSGSSPVDVRS